MRTFQPSKHSYSALMNGRHHPRQRHRQHLGRARHNPDYVDLRDGKNALIRVHLADHEGQDPTDSSVNIDYLTGDIEFLDNTYRNQFTIVQKSDNRWTKMLNNIADASNTNRAALNAAFPSIVPATGPVRSSQPISSGVSMGSSGGGDSSGAGGGGKTPITEKPWFLPVVIGTSLALVGGGIALYFVYKPKKA